MAERQRDGHTGLKSHVVDSGGPPEIPMVLTRLPQTNGAVDWVLHVSDASRGRQFWDALHRLSLKPFPGCPELRGSCLYAILFDLTPPPPTAHVMPGQRRPPTSDPIHVVQGFRHFSRYIEPLVKALNEAQAYVEAVKQGFETDNPFADIPKPSTGAEAPPAWLDECKLPELVRLETEFLEKRASVLDLQRYLPLLYATGDALEGAVIAALRLLGMRADPTTPGSNFDIDASTADGSQRLGIEVTGIEGDVGKKSNKVSQLLQHLTEREDNERSVLVVNAHRLVAPADRAPAFTKAAQDLLVRQEATLLLTSVDLYNMVADVIAGKVSAEVLVKALCETEGLVSYPGFAQAPRDRSSA